MRMRHGIFNKLLNEGCFISKTIQEHPNTDTIIKATMLNPLTEKIESWIVVTIVGVCEEFVELLELEELIRGFRFGVGKDEGLLGSYFFMIVIFSGHAELSNNIYCLTVDEVC